MNTDADQESTGKDQKYESVSLQDLSDTSSRLKGKLYHSSL